MHPLLAESRASGNGQCRTPSEINVQNNTASAVSYSSTDRNSYNATLLIKISRIVFDQFTFFRRTLICKCELGDMLNLHIETAKK